MSLIGTFTSKRWGTVHAKRSRYLVNDRLCIVLDGEECGPLTKLSVNLEREPELPEGCFHAKTWGENEELAQEALASGLFRPRDGLPAVRSGFITAPVWEIVPEGERK